MRNIKKFAVVVGTVVALIGGGVAFAYWTTSGSGSGTVGTSAGQNSLTVAQTSHISDLAPGVAPETLSGTVTNTGTNAAYVTSVTASIQGVSKADGAPVGTCDASDYTLGSAVMAVGQDLAAGNGSASFSGATLGFNDEANTNQDACKGATVTILYTVNSN